MVTEQKKEVYTRGHLKLDRNPLDFLEYLHDGFLEILIIVFKLNLSVFPCQHTTKYNAINEGQTKDLLNIVNTFSIRSNLTVLSFVLHFLVF